MSYYSDLAEVNDFLAQESTTSQTTSTGVLSSSSTGVLSPAPHRRSIHEIADRAKSYVKPVASPSLAPPDPYEMDLPELSLPVKLRALVKVPHEGTYTVSRRDGSHATYRLRVQHPDSDFMPGETMVSLLTSSDNESSYTRVGAIKRAELTDDRIILWKKFRTAHGDQIVDDLLVLMGSPLACAKAYGMRSGRCGICGRKLTVPSSIEAGLGPICADKF